MTADTLPRPLVETQWLQEHLDDPALVVVECSVIMQPTTDSYSFVSGEADWRREHIPGATFIDILGDLVDREHHLPLMMPTAAQFADVVGRHGIDNGCAVVIYDRGNHAWAARLWLMFRHFGHDRVAVLDGGWQKWAAEGRPASSGLAQRPPAQFRARPDPRWIADRDEVLAAIEREDVCLIHALSPEEFRGEEARYARPGRIRNSVNVFCQSLIDPETHAFHDAQTLRARFRDALPQGAERCIAYCGGGIAACSDALAMAAIGIDDVAVYDGSLSEWTADPDLPMDVG
jgi:thiosulfate/3-mercaptopyruvate sulfurtransferase